MENLKNAVDLSTYSKTNPFPGNELIGLVQKMHNAGIAHGDLHMGNVMVQKKPGGGIRLVIIDFGRSVNMAQNKKLFNFAIASNLRRLKNVVSSSKSPKK
jgi:tRNA A-37 threonylcarbamoyl transferase component Bud32